MPFISFIPAGAASPGFSTTSYVDTTGDDGTAVRGSLSQKFATVQAAIDASSAGDVIRVADGTYTETLTLKSNVSIIGDTRRGVIIAGDASWTPTDAIDEIPLLQSLSITGTLSMDGTGKSGGAAYLYCVDVSAGVATSVGRSGANSDGFVLQDIYLPENDGARWQLDVTDGVFISHDCELSEIFAHGDALISCRRTQVFGELNHDGTGSPSLLFCEIVGNVTLDNPTGTGSFAEARRTVFYGNVNVLQATSYDAYDCTFEGGVMTSGLGTVNRNDGDFVGANGIDSGRSGLVPAPSASHNTRFLRGDGNWAAINLPTESSISTSDATPTTIYTQSIVDQRAYVFTATITGISADGTQRAGYLRKATVTRFGGAPILEADSQVVGTDSETSGGMDAQFAISGNNVILQVTGVAATNMDWKSSTSFVFVNTGPS